MLDKFSVRSKSRSARLSAVALAGFVVASAMLPAVPLRAASYYWAVSAGDWSQTSNWGGTLPTSSDLAYVSNGGTAAITLSGEACNQLCLGDPNSTRSGTIQMSSGNLAVKSNEYLGAEGAGTFTQSGGTNSLGSNGSLTLGDASASSGSYNLSGSGLLSATTQYVGNYGAGTFTQSGGTNNLFSGALWLGYYPASSGSYNLSSSGLLSAGGYSTEGVGVSGAGTFTQSGGTNNLGSNGSLTLGDGSVSNGAYILGGAGLLIAGGEGLGFSGTGTFTQTGGTNNIGSGPLSLGSESGSSGTYNLSGSGQLSANQENLGLFGTATFIQSGGTNSVTSAFSLGASGTYNLTGGVLLVPGFVANSGVFKLGGGTLMANASFSTFDQALTLTGSGGNGNINTGGYSVTFSTLLSGPGGLNKCGAGVLTLTVGNTYTGGTRISAGTLNLDFVSAGAPTANIINNATNTSNLTLAGGVLAIQGRVGTTNSQQFNGLVVNPGCSAIVLTPGTSNPLLISLGSITRNAVGGTVDFTLPTGTTSGANGITTTTPNTNGIIGGYATVSGTNWATNSNGNIIAYSATSSYYASGNLGALSSSGALNVSPSGTQTPLDTADSFNTLNLTGTVGVSMTGSGLLQLADAGLIGNTTGSITGGTLEGSASGELIVITPLGLTIGSVIADNGGATALTKTGSAKLTLTASNTYSGATTVGAGTLQVSGTGTLGTGPVTDNSALVFNPSGTSAFGGAINGGGSLTKTGSGNLMLGSSNSFSGGATISQGALQLANSAALLNTTVAINSDNGLQFSPVIGTFYLGGLSGGNLLQLTNMANGAVGLVVGSNGASTTFSGAITGSGSLTKTGGGNLVFSGSDSYSGGTLVNAGGLQIGSGGTTGSLAGNITNNAALVFNRLDNPTFAGEISGSGSLTQTGSGILILLGSNTYTGGTTISAGTLQMGNGGTTGRIPGNVLDNAVLAFNLSMPQTFDGAITGSGGLAQAGPALLTLTGSNTYTGSTTISAGTLAYGGTASSLPGVVYVGTSGNAGTLLFPGASVVKFTATGDGHFNVAYGSTVAIQPGASVTLAGDLKLGALLSGSSGNLVQSGGTLIISDSSSGRPLTIGEYSSETSTYTLAGGLVSVPNSLTYAPWDGAAVFNISGGTANLKQIQIGSSDALATGGTIALSGSGALYLGSGGIVNGWGPASINLAGGTLGAYATWSSLLPISLNNTATIDTSGNGITLSGALSGSGSLTKVDSGTLTLAAANTFSGNTLVSGGTLALGNALALQDSTLDTSGSGVVGFGSLTSATLGGLSGLGTLRLTNSSSAAVALNVGNNNTNTTYSGTLSGAGSLTKIGGGTLVLSGSNSYTGGTAVDAGTLVVTSNTALPDGTSLTVGAGGAFVFDPSVSAAPVDGFSVAASQTNPLPEPGTLALLIAGLVVGFSARRRRKGI
jgi:autotransporter-associated beta strand protein